MALPDMIEMEPLTGPVTAVVTVPGSKSLTNRALVLAAMGSGETILRGALWSDDTRVMVAALRVLGFSVEVGLELDEPANRRIAVVGQGGRVPPGGTEAKPLELQVGNAGTAARFLSAMVCLGSGVYRLSGVARMHERPQAELLTALRALGYRVDSDNDRMPVRIHGGGRRPGRCRVSVGGSSQFASALLLVARYGGWEVEMAGSGDADELPYVDMTRRMVEVFPRGGGEYGIEPDASSSSYLWGADALWGEGTRSAGRIRVRGMGGMAGAAAEVEGGGGGQVDARFPGYLPLPRTISRLGDLGDSILTAMVLAPWAGHPVAFTDLGRLRVQECERVEAMRTELTRCGVRVREEGDTLTVEPGVVRGAEIETYGDHRMAMCFGMLGLRVAGMRIRDPGCVGKTFPNFFAKLAAPAPVGLGVCLREARTGRILEGADQLAKEG
jgi:3-phosphoshikimate 1-carboxyvinyltransferase